MAMRHEADRRTCVLIVGAGPVGLVAAARLEAFGIEAIVVEAEDAPGMDLRASTFHPPTLDQLDELDLGAPLVAQGLIAPTWQVRWHETGARAVFDLSILEGETRHPYRLQCEQDRLVRLIGERLRRGRAVEILRGARLVALVQDEGGCLATVEMPSGPERIHAAFVIGADGSRSTVRSQLDLAFEGDTYPETTLLVVTRFRFEDHLEGLSHVNYCWREGSNFSLLRLRDCWRVNLYPDTDEAPEVGFAPGAVARKLNAIVPTATPYEILESRPYRVHKRIVKTYRVGRVALAGDAAHINSPAGGMGMNGGIHDAFELTATLREIIRGGDLRLLDRYTRRRLPIAREDIIAQADANRARMLARDPEARGRALGALQATTANPKAMKAHLMRSAMLDGLRRAAAIA
ncbi:MAG: FAD-dependent oxidoreductase [Caulobacterales bacterium]